MHDTFMEISEYVMFVAAGWRRAIEKAVMGAGKEGERGIIASVH
jgi:hypothetical protein